MKAPARAHAGLLLLAVIAGPALADGPGWEHRRNLLQEPVPDDLSTAQSAESAHFRVRYEADTPDGKPPFNRMHSWTVTVEPKEPSDRPLKLAFAGEMPQHLHGLPTSIELSRVAPGRFVVDGLKFHMVGWWRFKLKVTDGARTEDVTLNLVF